MPEPSVSEKARATADKAGKTYAFADQHNPALPADWWFQESIDGLVLFIVFYTLACRWGRCLGCNLPSVCSSHPIGYRHIMQQVDHLFALPEIQARREAIRKVILSNNGSVLDEVTFSSTALMYFLAQCNLKLPGMAVLAIETRPEYVDLAELEFLSRALAEGETPTQLEVAIGFEVFDDTLRNERFRKGLPLDAVEALLDKIAPYGFHLKCYFMQKPVPGLSDEAGVEDIHRAIDYLDAASSRYGVTINMHLNPTYVARGTPLAEAFARGEYVPPTLTDVARAALHGAGKAVSIFIGLSDEGLAVEGGSFLHPGDTALVKQLETFNRTQDYTILAACTTPNR